MKKGNIFWGALFLLTAVFILVCKLGFIQDIGVWTILFTVFFGAIIIISIPKLSFPGILLPAAGLCILYDSQWGIEQLTPWPVIIIAVLASIGLSLIFKGAKKRRYHYRTENFGHVENKQDGSYVYVQEKFGSAIKYVNSDNFERADLSCSFGDLKVYFDNAIIQSDCAIIQVDASFSGIELYVPEEWEVIDQSQSSLSGVDIHSANVAKSKKVYLQGNISFSGVEVKTVPR